MGAGLINGVRGRLDDDSYVIRVTPRRISTIWKGGQHRRMAELADFVGDCAPGRRSKRLIR